MQENHKIGIGNTGMMMMSRTCVFFQRWALKMSTTPRTRTRGLRSLKFLTPNLFLLRLNILRLQYILKIWTPTPAQTPKSVQTTASGFHIKNTKNISNEFADNCNTYVSCCSKYWSSHNFFRQCLFCRQDGSSKRLGRNEVNVTKR